MNQKSELTIYEELQAHNRITSWLHTFRYKHMLAVLDELVQDRGLAELNILDIGCGPAKLYSILGLYRHVLAFFY